MAILTREDIEVVEELPVVDQAHDWLVRVAGLIYLVSSRPDHLGQGPATLALPWHRQDTDVDARMTEADPRAVMSESLVPVRDHWACIDRLLRWLSLTVEAGWSRPTLHISHRVDLEPVDLVVVFSVADVHTIKVWTVRDLASHFDAWRGDDLDDDSLDLHRMHPANLYVCQDGDLVAATYRRICHGDGDEIQVRVNGSVVAAARY